MAPLLGTHVRSDRGRLDVGVKGRLAGLANGGLAEVGGLASCGDSKGAGISLFGDFGPR